MGSTNGVKMNWPVVAIAFAVIGVPMGVAVIQDLGSDSDDEALLARIGEVDEIAEVSEAHDEADDEETDDEAGRWDQPAMEQAFFEEVFLGPGSSRPALGPLAGLEWGARHAEVPELDPWPRARVELTSSGIPHERLRAISIIFPDDGTAARVLASRWGESTLAVGRDDLARRIWTDPAAGLRLVLESHDGEARATFAPFVPVQQLIGPNGRFAFETEPILGAKGRTLALEYGSRFTAEGQLETGRIECPGTELSAADLDCVITFDGGKAVKLTVTVDHSFDPNAGPAVFAALRERLGEVRQHSSDDSGNTWVFDRGYTVTQRVGQPAITVVRVAR